MQFLAVTDEDFATAKTEMLRAKLLIKRAEAREFLLAKGNNAEREAQTVVSDDVGDAENKYIEWVKLYENLLAKRQRAEIVIDVFRTLEASRRKSI